MLLLPLHLFFLLFLFFVNEVEVITCSSTCGCVAVFFSGALHWEVAKHCRNIALTVGSFSQAGAKCLQYPTSRCSASQF